MPIQQFDAMGRPLPPNWQPGGDMPNPGHFLRAAGLPILSPQPVAYDYGATVSDVVAIGQQNGVDRNVGYWNQQGDLNDATGAPGGPALLQLGSDFGIADMPTIIKVAGANLAPGLSLSGTTTATVVWPMATAPSIIHASYKRVLANMHAAGIADPLRLVRLIAAGLLPGLAVVETTIRAPSSNSDNHYDMTAGFFEDDYLITAL